MTTATATATTVGELFAATVAEHEIELALRTPDGTVAWSWGAYGRQPADAPPRVPCRRHGRRAARRRVILDLPHLHGRAGRPRPVGRGQQSADHRAGLPGAGTGSPRWRRDRAGDDRLRRRGARRDGEMGRPAPTRR